LPIKKWKPGAELLSAQKAGLFLEYKKRLSAVDFIRELVEAFENQTTKNAFRFQMLTKFSRGNTICFGSTIYR
jgi:hypothetical protein